MIFQQDKNDYRNKRNMQGINSKDSTHALIDRWIFNESRIYIPTRLQRREKQLKMKCTWRP